MGIFICHACFVNSPWTTIRRSTVARILIYSEEHSADELKFFIFLKFSLNFLYSFYNVFSQLKVPPPSGVGPEAR